MTSLYPASLLNLSCASELAESTCERQILSTLGGEDAVLWGVCVHASVWYVHVLVYTHRCGCALIHMHTHVQFRGECQVSFLVALSLIFEAESLILDLVSLA